MRGASRSWPGPPSASVGRTRQRVPTKDCSRTAAEFRPELRGPASGRELEGRHDDAVRCEVAFGVEAQEFREPRAGAIDPTLDGPDRAAANAGGILVGKALGADEQKRFALVGRKFEESVAKVV